MKKYFLKNSKIIIKGLNLKAYFQKYFSDLVIFFIYSNNLSNYLNKNKYLNKAL